MRAEPIKVTWVTRGPQSCVATVRDDVELSFVLAQATRKTFATTVALEGISDVDHGRYTLVLVTLNRVRPLRRLGQMTKDNADIRPLRDSPVFHFPHMPQY